MAPSLSKLQLSLANDMRYPSDGLNDDTVLRTGGSYIAVVVIVEMFHPVVRI